MITTVTLNASIDKAYFMEKAIENGTVMRVATCRNSAGGKGLNVARTAKLCGADVQATGFAGGFNGKYLQHLLTLDQIPHDFVEVEGETRSCINILDPKYHSTEYLEPGFELTAADEQEFMARFPEIIKDSGKSKRSKNNGERRKYTMNKSEHKAYIDTLFIFTRPVD